MTQHLLPQPKDLSSLDGSFSLNTDTLIIIPAQAGENTFFAARQLQDEVCRAASLTLPIVKAFAPPRSKNVILLACGPEQAAAFGLEPVAISAPEAVTAQSYALTITPARITLYANTSTGLFYAVQTLRQLIRLHICNPSLSCHPSSQAQTLPALTIQDRPTLPYRGLMLDVSRRKVPTLTTLKQLAEELSHYKLNVLQLYTEHTFQFTRHPKIGASCGSLSSQDILELDSFCRARHVELMPNLQSFGHARNTLLIPEYQHLAETELFWTLSPAFEETYTLLDELYADMLPAFTSTTFNVDCDETYDLGQGASKALADEIGVGRVYLGHILRIRELATHYGCRIQIWCDIMLNHPELIVELPDDVTLLAWGYDPADEYPAVKIFAEAGRRFWVC
ncbi:MAG: beta-N-acetylhexosaminidase, partial [Anaerolineae bacterium]|nr:beta-N-acetylhexosaminidase [Anaerolineae bacterium]